MQVDHRIGLRPIYNSVFNQTTDACGLMNGSGDKAGKLIVDVISDSFPAGLLHPCPFFGEFKAYNVTFKSVPVFAQFLLGRFRATLKYYNDNDENIVTVIAEFELS